MRAAIPFLTALALAGCPEPPVITGGNTGIPDASVIADQGGGDTVAPDGRSDTVAADVSIDTPLGDGVVDAPTVDVTTDTSDATDSGTATGDVWVPECTSDADCGTTGNQACERAACVWPGVCQVTQRLGTQTYGGPVADRWSAAVELADGDLMLAGATSSNGAGGWDLWVARTNRDGGLRWARNYGTAISELGLAITRLGEHVVVGGVAGAESWLLALDIDGNQLWDWKGSGGITSVAFNNGTLYAGGWDGTAPVVRVFDADPLGGATLTDTWTVPGEGRINAIALNNATIYAAGWTDAGNGKQGWIGQLRNAAGVDWDETIANTAELSAVLWRGGKVVVAGAGTNAPTAAQLPEDGSAIDWQVTIGTGNTGGEPAALGIAATESYGYAVSGQDGGGGFVAQLNGDGQLQWTQTQGASLVGVLVTDAPQKLVAVGHSDDDGFLTALDVWGAQSCDAASACYDLLPSACPGGDACSSAGCDPTQGCIVDQVSCDDGIPCTVDNCNGTTGCTNTPDDGACQGGACELGTCTATGCETTPLDDGTSCDDNDPCSENEACLAGVCQGTAVDCDDSDPCTDDSCQAGTGCVVAPNTGASCDDGDACTSNDTCTDGVCAGTGATCNDNNPCTTDGCDDQGGCVFNDLDNGSACDDGDGCTDNDTCQLGNCVPGPPLACDDSNPCTDTDCLLGDCLYSPLVGAGCDDGSACTDDDQCQSGGGCAGTVNPDACDDGDACTTDGCDVDGVCQNDPIVCDDGNDCTTDTCDTTTGCVFSDQPDTTACDDGVGCTESECQDGQCVATTGCNDGDACTLDYCDGVACATQAVNCDDGDSCTTHTCDSAIGCIQTPLTDATSCDDGNACTTGEQCAGGACVGGGVTVWESVSKLNPPTPQGGVFGHRVEVDGDWMAVAEYEAPNFGGIPAVGAVHLYQRVAGAWTYVDVFYPSDGEEDDRHGSGLAIADLGGGVVGITSGTAHFDSPGKAYYREYDAGTGQWTDEEMIANPLEIGDADYWGAAITMTDTWAAIGARQHAGSTGLVVVYERVAGQWEVRSTLTNGQGFALFGTSVAIDGNTLVVGARDDSAGAAFVYTLTAGTGATLSATLNADGNDEDFGEAVAISGGRIAIGAPSYSAVANQSGRTYLFEQIAGSWVRYQILADPEASAFNRFGSHLSLDGSRLLVGSTGAGASNDGAVYLYERLAAQWSQRATLAPPAGEEIGENAFDGATLLVAAPWENGVNGAVYVYAITGGCDDGSLCTIDSCDPTGAGCVGTPVTCTGVDSDCHIFECDEGTGHCAISALNEGDNCEDGIACSTNSTCSGGQCTTANLFSETQQLTAQVEKDFAVFGYRVARDGNWLAVTEIYGDGPVADAGAVEVFQKVGETWTFHTRLTSADIDGFEFFGNGLAVRDLGGGGVGVAVGAPGADNWFGAVFVHEYDPVGGWAPVVRIDNPSADDNDQFGDAVAWSGDWLAVGALGASETAENNTGVVYLYQHDGSDWQAHGHLARAEGANNDEFGYSLALEGATLVVGGPGVDTSVNNAGAAFVYDFDGSDWNLVASLAGDDNNGDQERFGAAIALDTGRIVVGAENADAPGSNQGVVYVFENQTGSWTKADKLISSDGGNNDGFGAFVDIDGDQIVVGAPDADGVFNNDGAVYHFVNNGSSWVETHKIQTTVGAELGAVALEGTELVMGAGYFQNPTTFDFPGAVYVHQLVGGCSDGDLCSVDFCDLATGCGTTPVVCPAGSDCVTFACDSGTGACTDAPANEGTTCDDGDPCTDTATCSGGSCTSPSANTTNDVTITSPNPGTGGFGYVLAVDGDFLVTDDASIAPYQGVQLYSKASGDWEHVAQFEPPPTPLNEFYGYAMAVLDLGGGGVRVVVTDPYADSPTNTNSGVIYVYERPDGSSSFTTDVVANPTDGANHEFGKSVALFDGWLAVGATGAGASQEGVVHMLEKPGGLWLPTSGSPLLGVSASDEFGQSVAGEGLTLAVGATNDEGQGRVHIFGFGLDGWDPVQELSPSVGGAGDQFGFSVALDGNTLAIGAPGYDDQANAQGAAFLFTRDQGTWSEEDVVTAQSPGEFDFLGRAISVEGEVMVAGGEGGASFDGLVARFERSGTSWSNSQEWRGDGQIWAAISGGDVYRGAAVYDLGSGNIGAVLTSQYIGDCDDSDPCTVDMCDPQTGCQNTAINCDDGNACTADTCDPASGCQNTPDEGAACDDGNPCTNATCQDGSCDSGLTWSATKLLAPATDGTNGRSVSLHGNWLASGNDSLNTVTVFERVNGTWTFHSEVSDPDSQAADFGKSVVITDLSGGDAELQVSDPLWDSASLSAVGRVYHFDLDPGTKAWSSSVIASGAEADERLGTQLVRSGDWLAAGAPLSDASSLSDSGKVVMYERQAGNWLEEQTLVAPTPEASGIFGASIGLLGDRLVTGEDGATSSQGAVHVFEHDGSSWGHVQEIASPAGSSDTERFGQHVALSATRIVASGPWLDGGEGLNQGAIYVLTHDGNSWSAGAPLWSPAPAFFDLWGGYGLATHTDVIYVPGPAGAMRFEFDGNAWAFAETIANASNDQWGMRSVTNDGPRFATGLADQDAAAYVLDPPPPLCDDGDACTADSCNAGVGCESTPVVCDDGNACTTNTCDTSAGCVFTPVGDNEACEDGNLCTTGEVCTGGVCDATPANWSAMPILADPLLETNAEFGSAVAIDGEWMVVGQERHQLDIGQVHVYRLVQGAWVRQANFTTSATSTQRFGDKVAIEDKGAGVVGVLVGTRSTDVGFNNTGTAYYFLRDPADGSWTEQIIDNPEPGDNDRFGIAVALSGDGWMAVGAAGDTVGGVTGAGKVHLYSWDAGTSLWTPAGELNAPIPTTGDQYGGALDMAGPRMIVAAFAAGGGDGLAWIYERSGSTYGSPAELSGDGASKFGNSVGIDGDRAVVGDPTDSGANPEGRVYIFEASAPGAWAQVDKFASPNPGSNFRFGIQVAVDGNIIVAASFNHDAYIFERSGGSTHLVGTYSTSGGVGTLDVDVDNALALIGAPDDGAGQGRVFPTQVLGDCDDGDPCTIDACDLANGCVYTDVVCDDGDPCTEDECDVDFGCTVTFLPDTTPCDDGNPCVTTAVCTGGVCATSNDPWHEQKLISPAPGPYDFGDDVAIDGDWMVVAEPETNGGVGFYHVFSKTSGAWEYHSALPNGSSESFVFYTESMAIQADNGDVWVAIGLRDSSAVTSTAGQVRFFRLAADGSFVEEVVDNPAPSASDRFGASVALSGNWLVVGASGATATGAAYVFERSGDQWMQFGSALVAPGVDYVRFGAAVDIDGDLLAVGAPELKDGGLDNRGGVFVFRYDGSSWNSEATLEPTTEVGEQEVGASVAVSNGVVAAGAPQYSGNDLGAFYVWHKPATTWEELAFVEGDSPDESAYLGISIDMEGNDLVVGAQYHPFGSGQISYYTVAASGLTLVKQWTTSDFIGRYRVGVSGGTVIGGAPQDSNGAASIGGVYVWDLLYDCADTDPCTVAACDSMLGCQFPQKVCDDGDACTTSACDSGSGDCTSTPAADDDPCDDGNACTVSSSCQGGSCLASSAPAWGALARFEGTQNNEDFGFAVDIDGDWMVVGSPDFDAGGGTIGSSGMVSVFRRTMGIWELFHSLEPPTPVILMKFGNAVAVHDLGGGQVRVAVGAFGTNDADGAVHIYTYDGSAWSSPTTLDGPAQVSHFGKALAMNASMLVIGAPKKQPTGTPIGGAYVYTFGQPGLTELVPTTALDDLADFGISVAIIDDTEIAVGAPWQDPDGNLPGVVFRFGFQGPGWSEQGTLVPPSPVGFDAFGSSLAANANILVVGAPGNEQVFVYDTSFAAAPQTIVAADSDSGDDFGETVALSEDGTTLLVGAARWDSLPGGINTGAVYRYANTGTWTWQETWQSLNPEGAGACNTGGDKSVAVDGTTAVFAAANEDDTGTRRGAAYIYTVTAGCDDSNPCTQDSCDPIVGCVHTPLGCADDGDPCTVEVCNASTGQCEGLPGNDGAPCDDGEACTLGDTCFAGGCDGGLAPVGLVQTLTDTSPYETGSWMGRVVAVDGDWLVAGQHEGNGGFGSAHVYQRTAPGVWTARHELLPNATEDSAFGTGVDIADLGGGTARVVVGAPSNDVGSYNNIGTVHVFDVTATTANEVATLESSDPEDALSFGEVVKISGDWIAVADKQADGETVNQSGRIELFSWTGAAWEHQQTLDSPNGQSLGFFGIDIDLSGALLAVAASGEKRAYVYERSNGLFGPPVELVADFQGGAATWYGTSVAAEAGRIAVGARDYAPVAGVAAGGVFVFENGSGAWSQTALITPQTPQDGSLFGISVALSGDLMAVGAQSYSGAFTGSGAAYRFKLVGALWEELQVFEGNAESLLYGRDVDLTAETVVVGVPWDDTHGDNTGAAFVYEEVACP